MGSTASVLGASGFSGGELLRLLASHPAIGVVRAAGAGRAGAPVAEVLPHVTGAYDGVLCEVEEAVAAHVDVCFSCLPGGTLARFERDVSARVLVDLSSDFRAAEGWVYGLTEHARASLRGATRIANPGCYPTAVLLALVPFARAQMVGDEVIVDAVSGVTGAGRGAGDRVSLGVAGANVTAYGEGVHRHVGEMERGMRVFGDIDTRISFTPHLAPMPRGLLATVRTRPPDDLTDDDALSVLSSAYEEEPLVEVLPTWPATKPVSGTNRAHVSARIDPRTGLLIASAAIDNLGKGAAGQAVQNANIALGIDETTGLEGFGVWP